MWRRFWFRSSTEAQAVAYGAEVLDANWIAPPPAVPVAAPARTCGGGDSVETDAFLLRVYANQQC